MLNNTTLKLRGAEVFTSMCPLCYYCNAFSEDSDTQHWIQLKLPLQKATCLAGRFRDLENRLSYTVNITLKKCTFVACLQLMQSPSSIQTNGPKGNYFVKLLKRHISQLIPVHVLSLKLYKQMF